MKKLQASRGYTLLEALIYIAVLALISYLVVSVLITMVHSFLEGRRLRALNEAGAIVMERLVREIRAGKYVETAASEFNIHPGRLVLNSTDVNGNSYLAEFSTDVHELSTAENTFWITPVYASPPTFFVGAIALQVGQGEPTILHPSYISADSVIFRLISTPVSQAVKIDVTLSDIRRTPPLSATFHDTVVLRGSY